VLTQYLCGLETITSASRMAAAVVAPLIVERPGLATAGRLSDYLPYRPRTGQTDADRKLISNIHAAGTGIPEAGKRIVALSARLMELHMSGCAVRNWFRFRRDRKPATWTREDNRCRPDASSFGPRPP
jgi:ethanolamine ammonia-lyase small subunit